VLFCISVNCSATVLIVDQNGGGDYLSINEAITAAEWNDTILISPGTYIENIELNELPLTIASLYLTTSDISYIAQTIIDGNQNGSVIHIHDMPMPSCIVGLTITNGNGTPVDDRRYGGGIYVNESAVKISHCIIDDNDYGGILINHGIYSDVQNCIISNNESLLGTGGISIEYQTGCLIKNCQIINNYGFFTGGISNTAESLVTLEGTSVRYNKGGFCGGFQPNTEDTWQFHSENLNSIYGNYGRLYCDFPVNNNQTLALDTITCSTNSTYYIWYPESDTFPQHLVTYNTSIMEEIDADLYVSSTGNNSNDGLSPETPFKSIWYAMYRIKDGTTATPRTIHIEDGTYAFSIEEQFFPICGKNNVSLIGESSENTVIDFVHFPNMRFYYIYTSQDKGDISIKNMRITNLNCFNSHIFISGLSNVELSNLIIDNNTLNDFGVSANVISLPHCHKITLKDINIRDCQLPSPSINLGADSSILHNIILDNIALEGNGGWPGSTGITILNRTPTSTKSFHQISNLQCTNLESHSSANGLLPSALRLCWENATAVVTNSTFGHSESNRGAAVTVADGANLFLYNSIIYGNDPLQLSLYYDEGYEVPPFMEIDFCLVEGGEYAIHNQNDSCTLVYGDNNIFANPNWMDTGDYPYYLRHYSPCIDAGTEALPFGVELPDKDILGYPRIFGDAPDMGAYEWVGTTPGISDNFQSAEFHCKAYPNPFHYHTRITCTVSQPGKLSLEIYSLNGMKVLTLAEINSGIGEYEFLWNGTDKSGNTLDNGIYILRASIDGEAVQSLKVEKNY